MTASPPVPPSPSPSLSDADDAIRAILEQAKILHASLTPLYTWSTLCRIIQSCDLAVLSRQPEFERLYAEEFGPLVRRTYGGMEVYLRKQLGWGQPEGGKGQGEGEKDREYWTREGRTNVRRNDWPYGIPTDVTCVHFPALLSFISSEDCKMGRRGDLRCGSVEGKPARRSRNSSPSKASRMSLEEYHRTTSSILLPASCHPRSTLP